MKFPKDAVLLAIAYGDRQILKDIVNYTETTITIIFKDFADFEEFAFSLALPNMWGSVSNSNSSINCSGDINHLSWFNS